MELLQTAGYGISALAYLAVSFLLLTTQKRHYIKQALLVFGLFTSLWLFSYAILSWNIDGILPYIPLFESLKNIVWLYLLTAILNTDIDKFSRHIRQRAFLFPSLYFLATPIIPIFLPLTEIAQHQLFMVASIFAALLQLILVEQIHRRAKEGLWAYKLLILAVGGVSTFDFFVFSESLLIQTIDANYLAARGYIYLIAVPLLVLSIRRIKSWDLRIYVSRDVVLQSSLLFLAGAYLSLMALAGYFIKNIGGSWTGAVQIIFSCIAVMFLLTVFISDNFRKTFKIYISKHFFANQFDYREEWLKLTKTLTTASSAHNAYDLGLKGMLEAIKYESGAYLKCADSSMCVVSSHNLALHQLQIDNLVELMQHTPNTKWMFDIEDMLDGNDDYKQVTISVENIASAGIQLVIPVFINHALHGVFVLSSGSKGRTKLNWEIRDYISAVTSQIGSYFSFFEASSALAENAQFAAFNRMSAFVVHDLKNVVAQINLIIQNSVHYKHNPEFIDDTFETLTHTRNRMDKMLGLLMNKKIEQDQKVNTDIIDLITGLLQGKFAGTSPIPKLNYAVPLFVLAEKDRLAHVLSHLIDNAQQACKGSGEVNINVTEQDEFVSIAITDTGIGMSAEFISERLFKPFDTTKGNAGMGIGAYDAKDYAESHQGQLVVESELGQGTTMQMLLPKGENN